MIAPQPQLKLAAAYLEAIVCHHMQLVLLTFVLS